MSNRTPIYGPGIFTPGGRGFGIPFPAPSSLDLAQESSGGSGIEMIASLCGYYPLTYLKRGSLSGPESHPQMRSGTLEGKTTMK